MAETMSLIDNPQHPGDGLPESSPPKTAEDKSPFRRIEFHLARKPFTGFSNGGGGGSFRLETLNPTTTSSDNSNNQHRDGSGNASSGKKRDASELENGFDPELSFGITFRRIGAGLENLGNTCFLNSVLQCLTYTEPLAAYLQSGKHQITCRNAGFCALCAIQKHVSRALQASGRSLAPKDLVSNLRCISRTFRNSRQEDAHEYMVNLLESMHKCCLPSGVPSESPSAYERSLVHKIFGGRLRSQVRCMQCNYCSNKFDPFLDLSLEILKAETLYKAFANFTAKEQLDGGAKQYQCQQCKQKVKALKQLTIHKAPNVLTIHLKRFGSHMSGQKIDKKIQFGPTLDLKPFVTGPYDGDLKYTLYGVLVHAGWSTHSGHYYCFVRTSSGMWYALDDNQVFQVSEKKVFEQKAYMLFYFRDRKSLPLKKPAADVVHQKEKMVINSMERNNTCSIVSEGTKRDTILSNGIPHSSAAAAQRDAAGTTAPKTYTNSTIDNRTLEGLKSSAVVGAERDAPSTVTPTASDLKEDGVQKIISESLIEGSAELRSQNDTEKVPSVILETENACSPRANFSVEKGHDSHKQNDAMEEEGSTKNNVGDAVSMPSSSNSHQNSYSTIDQKETFSTIFPECKENNSPSENLSGSAAVLNNCSKPLETPEDAACITGKISSDKIGVPQEDAGGELFGASGVEDSQKGAVTLVSAELSNLPTMGSSSTTKKALDNKTRKKMKKNLLKCKLTSMKFCSKFVIGASLKQRKKKKHKQGKRGKLQNKDLTQEKLMDVECIPRDEGPSSSNKMIPQEEAKRPHYLMKGLNAGSNIEDKNGGMPVNPIESELKARVDEDGAVLATSLETTSSGVSAGSQSELKEPSIINDCERIATQKELLRMLTRGLEDRVPRWDEDESTPSALRETKGGLRIGYIGDEWDEEYDRGKRKKVRSSSTRFDGKNPFQDIANERIKSKAAGEDKQFKEPSTRKHKHLKKPWNKKDKQFKRSYSGNKPFRI